MHPIRFVCLFDNKSRLPGWHRRWWLKRTKKNPILTSKTWGVLHIHTVPYSVPYVVYGSVLSLFFFVIHLWNFSCSNIVYEVSMCITIDSFCFYFCFCPLLTVSQLCQFQFVLFIRFAMFVRERLCFRLVLWPLHKIYNFSIKYIIFLLLFQLVQFGSK